MPLRSWKSNCIGFHTVLKNWNICLTMPSKTFTWYSKTFNRPPYHTHQIMDLFDSYIWFRLEFFILKFWVLSWWRYIAQKFKSLKKFQHKFLSIGKQIGFQKIPLAGYFILSQVVFNSIVKDHGTQKTKKNKELRRGFCEQ